MSQSQSSIFDKELVAQAKNVLSKEYTINRHHVAVALSTGSGTVYKSLHMDCKGFDVCAEPIAIHNALQNNELVFKQIIAVTIDSRGKLKIITPCGNCRQILLEYTPQIKVIVDHLGEQVLLSPIDLLPHPYE